MACINLTSQKIKKDNAGKIITGMGNFDPRLSIYYEADLNKILGNAGGNKILEYLNIIITSSKHGNGGEYHLTVLAIKDPTSDLEYEPLAAGPWPPFYHQVMGLPKPGEEATDSDL